MVNKILIFCYTYSKYKGSDFFAIGNIFLCFLFIKKIATQSIMIMWRKNMCII